ncbi:MAG: hypothetical protein M3R71_04385, partial [Actinomycetota bacterium]|nr:hypothetical protein [Actinomycetota bacterium]
MRMLTKRRGALFAIVAGATLMSLGLPAGADPTLGGWSVTADGNGVDIIIDNATGLAGAHPFTEADFPAAQSDFESGPFGTTLASVFWPGSAGGNFGSLSSELPVPAQLQPLLSQTNDPVKASAQYPAGPSDASYPPGPPSAAIEMTAHADANGDTATAALTDETIPTFIGFGSAKGTSTSVANTSATATANSALSGITLLGGLIDIGSVACSAKATSDGTNSSGTAVCNPSQVTVLGQPASIGTNGLTLPTSAAPATGLLGSAFQSLVQQEVTALGITLTTLPSTQTQNGAADAVTAGGVRLEVRPNPALVTTLEGALQNPPVSTLLAAAVPSQLAILTTLPGLLQGIDVTITMGRVTASAAASPPFNSTFTPTPPVAGTTSGVTPVVDTSGSSPGSAGSAGTPPSLGTLAGGSAGTPSVAG